MSRNLKIILIALGLAAVLIASPFVIAWYDTKKLSDAAQYMKSKEGSLPSK